MEISFVKLTKGGTLLGRFTFLGLEIDHDNDRLSRILWYKDWLLPSCRCLGALYHKSNCDLHEGHDNLCILTLSGLLQEPITPQERERQ
ncbi:unnamed protein product [Brassica rapa subsp. trilocularis]